MAALEKLATASALASFNYQYRVLLPGNDPRGINIGFMSKYPIDNAYTHKDDSFTRVDAPAQVYKYTRDALEVHMTYRGTRVVFIGVHFKAKADPDDPDKRIAEAQYTRVIADSILQNDPSAYVWVLGDFNDTPESIPTQAVKNGKAGPIFVDAAESAAAADKYTYTYKGTKQLIDHMFTSPGTAQRLDAKSVIINHDDSDSDHAPIGATFQVP